MGSKSKRTHRRSKSVCVTIRGYSRCCAQTASIFRALRHREAIGGCGKSEQRNCERCGDNGRVQSALSRPDQPNSFVRWGAIRMINSSGPRRSVKLAMTSSQCRKTSSPSVGYPEMPKPGQLEDESILLSGVYALVQTGLSERAAVRTIADAKVFPHYERRSWQRPSGRKLANVRAKRALWRKYQRLRARSKGPDPIARQLGIGVTDFESVSD